MMMDQIKGKGIFEDPNSKEGSAYGKKDNHERGHLPNLDHFSKKGSTEQSKKRYDLLIRRLETVEDINGLGSMDVSELGLVHDLVIPSKFKTPEFEKYDGTECPKTHLVAYYRKMAGYTNDKRLLIHVFQESLTKEAFKWYLRLKND